MAQITYEDIIPTLVPNTSMVRGLVDGVARNIRIYPEDGYVLHLKRDDGSDIDPETGEEFVVLRFCSGMKSVNINYDFSVKVQDTYTYTDENGNDITIPIEKIGAEEIFTLPESIVPTAQIFGGGNNNHEVMSTDKPKETETK